MTPEQQCLNAEKSLALASALFPQEKWIPKEANIWVAKSRLAEKYKEPDKWEREMSQARILTCRGSMAYFLPEKVIQWESRKQCADLVLDGEIVEMKMVSGSRVTLGGQFRYGFKQGSLLLENCIVTKKHSVFIRLLSDLSVGSVKAKIAGELKGRKDEGSFICFFEKTGELYTWTYEELRSIIGQ
ncbi:MAG: hypothetical protein LBI06_06285 [Treponema sp.]|jgi:hypothetical protein|nr:hypothetical protein [Treponema sp.]